MQEKDIKGLLSKVDELKMVFSFGVRFVPFLEDLLVFVQEMAPMLNEMNRSIQDSSAKMPKAVQQLDKVTSATELATNEILDRVDSMLARMDEVNASFNLIRGRLSAEQGALNSIAGAIEELLAIPGVRESLNRVFEDKRAREKGVEIKRIVDEFIAGRIEDSVPEKVEQALQDTQSDAYDIMNALQVQDITAQQIEGAHALLRSVQERLNELIVKYSEVEPPQEVRKTRAHDMEASYTDADQRQQYADEAILEAEKLLDGEADLSGAEGEAGVEDVEADEMPLSRAFDEHGEDPGPEQDALESVEEESALREMDEILSWDSDAETDSALPGEEDDLEALLDEETGAEEAEAEEPADSTGTDSVAETVQEPELQGETLESIEVPEDDSTAGEPEPEPEDIDLDALLDVEAESISPDGEEVLEEDTGTSEGVEPTEISNEPVAGDEKEREDNQEENNLKISQEEIDKLFQ